MSFFLPDRLTCFLCKCVIEQRVEAAQLHYAHPDDVGEVARHGRGWVHRACWNDAALRETWAASAHRLLSSDPENVCSGGVICRLLKSEILLQDPWQAVSIIMPLDRVPEFLHANEHGGEVSYKSTKWTFKLVGDLVEVTGTGSEEPFERFRQAPGRWSSVLSRLPAATSSFR